VCVCVCVCVWMCVCVPACELFVCGCGGCMVYSICVCVHLCAFVLCVSVEDGGGGCMMERGMTWCMSLHIVCVYTYNAI